MAHIFKTFANRLTVGSQTAAGIVNTQKLPYESSTFGGLSILNGPVQIGVAPLSAIPLGVLHVGPSTPTSGPIALSAIQVTHPVKGIKVDAVGEGVDIIAGVMGLRVTAPNNYIWGNLQVNDAIVLSKIKNSTGTSCSFSGSSINTQGWKGFDIKHPNK